MLCRFIRCLCQRNTELIQSPMPLECWVCWQLAGVREKVVFVCCREQQSSSRVYSPHNNCIATWAPSAPVNRRWIIRLWLMALDVRQFFLSFLRMVIVWHLCRTNYLLVHQARCFVLHSAAIGRFALGLLYWNYSSYTQVRSQMEAIIVLLTHRIWFFYQFEVRGHSLPDYFSSCFSTDPKAFSTIKTNVWHFPWANWSEIVSGWAYTCNNYEG